ncbi:MAG: DUF134 domain-containing protein [Candidatus Cloacimonetes bacterium]|nr:DUF134 domain-containing protein [Candidatus Cloacimonadota bacterium]
MTRPKKERLVKQPPLFTAFKPVGIRRYGLETVLLSLDEYEAIRLADQEGLEHSEAAVRMEISRPTFTRLIDAARKKLADFIMNGKLLQIEGGSIHFKGNVFKCNNCGKIIALPMDEHVILCPYCESEDITDLAENHGHGDCCRDHENDR